MFHPDEYVNRKNFTSVQLVCDGKEKFTNVVAKWPGSVHDARVLKMISLSQILPNLPGQPLDLGDSGYGIAPYLTVPYSNPQTGQQRCFNRVFTIEHVIIERCIGQLKRRFPAIAHPVRIKLERIPGLIVSCVVLHNQGSPHGFGPGGGSIIFYVTLHTVDLFLFLLLPVRPYVSGFCHYDPLSSLGWHP